MANYTLTRFFKAYEAFLEWVKNNDPKKLTKNVKVDSVDPKKKGKRLNLGQDIHDLLLEKSADKRLIRIKKELSELGITTLAIQNATAVENREIENERLRLRRNGKPPLTWEDHHSSFAPKQLRANDNATIAISLNLR